MSFEVYGAESSDGGSSIDFEALNKYVVETADLEAGETLVGYVSNIVDLGTQKLPDAEYDVDEGDEDLTIGELTDKYADEIEEGRITKFDMAYDNGVKKIRKFVPQKNRQAVTYSVDFPDIILDKAQFFGQDSDPQPLRLWVGGEWWDKNEKERVLNSVIALKKTKDKDIGWTMHPLSQFYKMAVASKIIKAKQPFLPEMIDQLLGKSLQFKAQIFFNERNGESYYNEKVNFVGGLARGQKEIEDVKTHLIMFNQESDEDALRGLRKHVINTMARATNFEGSVVQKQLIALGRYTPKGVESAGSEDGVESEEKEQSTEYGFE